MIIQELCRYYDRLAASEAVSISFQCFSQERIHEEIVIDKKGNLEQFNDLRIRKGKKIVPRKMIVPQSFKRAGVKAYRSPFFLWDNTGFALGKERGENDRRGQLKFKNFKRFHRSLLSRKADQDIRSFLLFLSKWKISDTMNLKNWQELAGGNVVFRIKADKQYLHQKPLLRKIWLRYLARHESAVKGMCLATGKTAPIARIHPPIKNLANAATTGAALIACSDKAYQSFGKEQSFNAPVSEAAAFSYTTALNYLLSADSRQKIQTGDLTTVFWTEKESLVEGMLSILLDPKNAEISDNMELRQALESIRQGNPLPNINEQKKIFILGLSPNVSRISVRFWHACTVGELLQNIGQHFRDLNMQRNFDSEQEYPGIWRILKETVNPKVSDKSPLPLLTGLVLEAILPGSAYPQALQNSIINRIRADHKIDYIRTAILKAIIVRKYRLNKQTVAIPPVLDKENKDQAYLLGRLLATLEKVQQEALGKSIKVTIKDYFLASASVAPRMVFPQLFRLSQHFIEKAVYGKVRNKEITEIGYDISDLPAHMNIDKQGLFSIGYYHQHQDYYKSKESRKKR